MHSQYHHLNSIEQPNIISFMFCLVDLDVGVVDRKLTLREAANFPVLMERSAMSDRQKKFPLTQEVLRILRNIKQDLPDSVENAFLSELSLRMNESGHSERLDENQLARSAAGTFPLYCPKRYKAEERRRKKQIGKTSWYKLFSTVFFCPPTPECKLATVLRK